MNRAFLLILAPALFVALLFLALGWGVRMPAGLAAAVLALAVAALVWKIFKRKTGDAGDAHGNAP